MISPYRKLGGATGVRALADRFYRLMETLPEAAKVRELHPEDLRESREQLFAFLSGWLGGPSLHGRRCCGEPRLRAQHLPFGIDEDERGQWILCMDRALAELHIDEHLRNLIAEAFQRMADHLQNQYLCQALEAGATPNPCCRREGDDKTEPAA